MAIFIDGLGNLAKYFGRMEIEIAPLVSAATDMAAQLVKKEVDDLYGSKSELAPLADFTQQDRAEQGFSSDEPLLRDGKLLKDSVKIVKDGPTEAVIGSDEVIHVYHEFGYWNVRHGVPVPPRPIFKIAASKSIPLVEQLAEHTIGLLFGIGGGFSVNVDTAVSADEFTEDI